MLKRYSDDFEEKNNIFCTKEKINNHIFFTSGYGERTYPSTHKLY